MRFQFLLLGGALFAAPQTIQPQIPGDPLAPIVAEALENNLGLAQMRALSDRADARVREARSRFLPSLALESRHSSQQGTLNLGDAVNPAYAALNQLIGAPRFPTDVDVSLPRPHETRLRLTQPLFDPVATAAYDQSQHARDAQDLERRAAARKLASDAQSAFLNVAAARSARATWEAALELVAENERVAERLVEAGRSTPDAVFRARAERSEVEQQLDEARETELATVRSFNRLLRRPLEQPVHGVADSVFRFDLTIAEDEAVAHALSRREELAAVDAELQAAAANVRLANASFLPSVAVALDYGVQGRALRFDSNDEFTVASLVLSWDVFNGGRDIARRQGATADAERLRLRRAELEDLIRLDVRQAYGAARVARTAIATADARQDAAQRTFDLVRRRYEEGLATPLEFLDARTTLTDARLNQVISVYRYALRYVELERAAALRELPQ
jgi:outer membrane protein TolC